MSLQSDLDALPIRWEVQGDLGVPDKFALRTASVVTAAAAAGLTRGKVPDPYAGTHVYQLDPVGCNPAVPWWTVQARGRGDCQDFTAWVLAWRKQQTGEWPTARLVNGGRPRMLHVRLKDEDPSLILARRGRVERERGKRGPECIPGVWPDDAAAWEAGGMSCGCDEAGAQTEGQQKKGLSGAQVQGLLGDLFRLLGGVVVAVKEGQDRKKSGKKKPKPPEDEVKPDATDWAAQLVRAMRFDLSADKAQAGFKRYPEIDHLTQRLRALRGEDEAGYPPYRVTLMNPLLSMAGGPVQSLPQYGLVYRPMQHPHLVQAGGLEELHPLLQETLRRGRRAGLPVELGSGHRSPWRQIELWEIRMRDDRNVIGAPATWEAVEKNFKAFMPWVAQEALGKHKWRHGRNKGKQRVPLMFPGLSRHQAQPALAADVAWRGPESQRTSGLNRLELLAPKGVSRPLSVEPWHFAVIEK